MLRAKERWPRLPHLLVAVGLLSCLLHGPALRAAPPDGCPQPEAAERPAVTAPPFDVSFVPPDAEGVVALRPATLFRQPGMRQYARIVDERIRARLLAGGRRAFDLSIADIEQVVCPVNIGNMAGKDGLIGAGPAILIRSVNAFNWKKQMLALAPDMAEIHHGGVAYYWLPTGLLGQWTNDSCLLFPDARTVVVLLEKDLHRMIDQGKKWKASQDWGDRWKQIDRDLAAVSFRAEILRLGKAGDDPGKAALHRALQRVTASIKDSATFKAHIWLQCRNEQGAQMWQQSARTWLEKGASARKKALARQDKRTAEEKAFDDVIDELFTPRLTRQGPQLLVKVQSSRRSADLVGMMVSFLADVQRPASRGAGK